MGRVHIKVRPNTTHRNQVLYMLELVAAPRKLASTCMTLQGKRLILSTTMMDNDVYVSCSCKLLTYQKCHEKCFVCRA